MGQVLLTGKERPLLRSEIISSRTDQRGVITFINRTFTQVTGYTSEEAIGVPHNIIRHPDMPRALYKILWDAIKSGEQFFGVTKNRCKNGDYYWTLGYFQPDFNAQGLIIGFRSTRKGLEDDNLKQEFEDLYKSVRQEELKYPRPQQVEVGVIKLSKELKRHGFSDYQAFAQKAL